MGKGTIISGGTDGQYQLQINYDRTQYNNAISVLDTNIAELETKIAGMSPEDKDYNIVVLQKTALEKKKQTLQNSMPVDETISAWCADFTEDLSGVVGIVEIPGESQNIQIKPGYSDDATYNQSADGQLVPTVTQGAAQTFYNLAMLPGWQKWKPTFRYGIISDIDNENNTCNVTLENAVSSQQSINVNQSSVIENVPIEYMSCNSAAFKNGDDVLVKFENQDWTQPKVIGFKEEPKACVIPYLYIECEDMVIIWELEKNIVSTKVTDNSGNIIESFPVDKNSISTWLSEKTTFSSPSFISTIYVDKFDIRLSARCQNPPYCSWSNNCTTCVDECYEYIDIDFAFNGYPCNKYGLVEQEATIDGTLYKTCEIKSELFPGYGYHDVQYSDLNISSYVKFDCCIDSYAYFLSTMLLFDWLDDDIDYCYSMYAKCSFGGQEYKIGIPLALSSVVEIDQSEKICDVMGLYEVLITGSCLDNFTLCSPFNTHDTINETLISNFVREGGYEGSSFTVKNVEHIRPIIWCDGYRGDTKDPWIIAGIALGIDSETEDYINGGDNVWTYRDRKVNMCTHKATPDTINNINPFELTKNGDLSTAMESLINSVNGDEFSIKMLK